MSITFYTDNNYSLMWEANQEHYVWYLKENIYFDFLFNI